MQQHLIPITNDLFDIAARLQAIEPCYRVYFNAKLQRYEVHNSAKPPAHSLEFVVPYRELDSRTVDYALFTRVQNAERLLAEVERHNARLEKQTVSRAAEQVAQKIEETL